jgi:hypothetical protein
LEVIMQHARNTHDASRTLTRALGIAAAAALLALVGCTMVGDRITGVTVTRKAATTCIKQCNDLYKTLYDEEQKLHDANVEECQSLDQPEKGACLAAESARHAAEMERLGQAKIDCQDGCHDQGGGTAG